MKCSLVNSNFLEEISSLSHFFIFLCFFALITEEGFLISPYFSFELYIQMGISFLFSFACGFYFFLSYLSGLFRQPFCFFCISFSWGLFWSLLLIQCQEPPSIVLQALCLSDLILWIYLMAHLKIIPTPGKLVLNIFWKDWCWSWNSNTLATWCEELTPWKRPWCWERLKNSWEGDRGWDGWMASLTQWT